MHITENNTLFTSSIKMWLAIVILAISTFTIVTAELAPIGLLTPMANGLAQSEAMIGLTVTFYAWIGALSALISFACLGHLPKKPLLLTLMLVLFLSNVLCALSSNYSILVAARIIGALSHGAFWAMIGALAMSLVPVRHIGLATSIVFGGVSAASVFGVPIANYIGNAHNWQMAFWLISALSLFSLLGILILIPDIKTSSSIGITAFKQVIGNRFLIKIYAATFLAITAHFSAFTYIEPYLSSSPYVESNMVAILLFTFGTAGLIGNFITGVFIDKYLKKIILLSILIIAITLFILGIYSNMLKQNTIFLLIPLWGISISGIFVGFQTWVLRIAQNDAFPASAIYVAIFNGAIGSGALLGAWIVANYDFTFLMTVSGIAITLSLFMIAMIPSQKNIQNTLLAGDNT
jgi:predicted MFS family arabinose efflux permease